MGFLPLALPHTSLWNPDRLCASQPGFQTPHYKSHPHGHKAWPPLVASQLITSALPPAVSVKTTHPSSLLAFAPAGRLLCHALPSLPGWSYSPFVCSHMSLEVPSIRGPQWLCRPAVPLRLPQKWAPSTLGLGGWGAFASVCHRLLVRLPQLTRTSFSRAGFGLFLSVFTGAERYSVDVYKWLGKVEFWQVFKACFEFG